MEKAKRDEEEVMKKKKERERMTLEKTKIYHGICWQFSKRISILTTAAQQDVEMADTALYLNLC